jgi:hypothetical protein
MVISAVETNGAVPPGIYTPTRWKGWNTSPTWAPWEFLADQSRRRERFEKAAMFLADSVTAVRNSGPAFSEACIRSAWVTGICSGVRVAPSKRWVNSTKAASPRVRTASMMARVRSSMTGSKRDEAAAA